MKNKVGVFTVMLLFNVLFVFAQPESIIVIQEAAGTVEIKRAGSPVWEKAEKGQILAFDTIISTGFRSTALVQAGITVITVRPLTRLSLTELMAAEGAETLNIGLQTGRVRVEVSPPAGTRALVNLQGPMATASVRGTVFEFDTINLFVNEGTVELSGSSGAAVLVDAGGFSYTDERTGRAASTETTIQADLRPDLPVTSGITAFSGSIVESIGVTQDPRETFGLDTTIRF